MKKVLTLCLIVDENKILLGMKKKRFWRGKVEWFWWKG
jgi:hypothetical protein